MTLGRALSVEEQRVRLDRIIELRDVYELTWKQIGARLGFESTYCATLYRRHKTKEKNESS